MLSFDVLRESNTLRLPKFKNSKGETAHALLDGSDWSFASWFTATLGEFGELASVRIAYETGAISRDTYRKEVAKELADVATYLDILARRAFDEPPTVRVTSAPSLLMALIAHLGNYANAVKKYIRGDFTIAQLGDIEVVRLGDAYEIFHGFIKMSTYQDGPSPEAHPDGVDLGKAIREKFNEVSDRVGCEIKIIDNGLYDEDYTQING